MKLSIYHLRLIVRKVLVKHIFLFRIEWSHSCNRPQTLWWLQIAAEGLSCPPTINCPHGAVSSVRSWNKLWMFFSLSHHLQVTPKWKILKISLQTQWPSKPSGQTYLCEQLTRTLVLLSAIPHSLNSLLSDRHRRKGTGNQREQRWTWELGGGLSHAV